MNKVPVWLRYYRPVVQVIVAIFTVCAVYTLFLF